MAKKIVIRPGNANIPIAQSSEKKLVLGNRSKATQSPPSVTGYKKFFAKKTFILGISIVLSLLLCFLLWSGKKTSIKPIVNNNPIKSEKSPKSLEAVLNFNPNNFIPKDYSLTINLSLKEWLDRINIKPDFHDELISQAALLGIDSLYRDKTVKIYQDTSKKAVFALYPLARFQYARFQFAPYPNVSTIKLPVTIREGHVGGVLNDSLSLFMHLVEAVNTNVAQQAEEVLKHSVDLYHLDEGAEYRVIYEEKMSINNYVEIGVLKAISIKTDDKTYYAIRCNTRNGSIYLDEYAKSLEKNFLLAPVKNVRISSRYDINRLHPVLGITKAHLGTDYAAPLETEIFSVADGEIIEASSSRFNGNYLKIRHKNPYMTQYLHMASYASGIRPGIKVRMGQVIGYVGQTGENITGPHVCFRFWKNGQQVDHLKEPFKAIPKLKMKEEDQCRKNCEEYQYRLDKLRVTTNDPLGF